MIFVLLGPSGCGKGTQARLLAQKFGLTHISTGAILRAEHEKGTAVGAKAFEYWGQGQWTPTQIVEPLLKEELLRYPQGNFVLEGWPRLSEQKDILDKFLTEHQLKIDKVFYLETPVEISKKRIEHRVTEAMSHGQQPRLDEGPEVVEQRLRTFHNTIGPILDYYREKGLLEIIDNQAPIAEVFEEITKRING